MYRRDDKLELESSSLPKSVVESLCTEEEVGTVFVFSGIVRDTQKVIVWNNDTVTSEE